MRVLRKEHDPLGLVSLFETPGTLPLHITAGVDWIYGTAMTPPFNNAFMLFRYFCLSHHDSIHIRPRLNTHCQAWHFWTRLTSSPGALVSSCALYESRHFALVHFVERFIFLHPCPNRSGLTHRKMCQFGLDAGFSVLTSALVLFDMAVGTAFDTNIDWSVGAYESPLVRMWTLVFLIMFYHFFTRVGNAKAKLRNAGGRMSDIERVTLGGQ